MEPIYRYEIDQREIFVFDDFLPAGEVAEIFRRRDAGPYLRSESDTPETKHIRTFAADLDPGEVRSLRLFSEIERLVPGLFPGEDLQPYRAYCNLMLYGDMAHPHRDCHVSRTDVTALYYVNEEWKQEWGGETIFFNDRGDSVLAIGPRPGRLVVFRGAIEHRVGIPLRECYASRLTIAYKFKAPGEWR